MKDYQCLNGMIEDSKSKLMTAYDKGYKQGQKDNADWVSEKTNDIGQAWYNKGVKDMFDALTKLAYDTHRGGYSGNEIEEIFGTTYEPEILEKFKDNPVLLIENIKEYEERKKQSKIANCSIIGDECIYQNNPDYCNICIKLKEALIKAKEING